MREVSIGCICFVLGVAVMHLVSGYIEPEAGGVDLTAEGIEADEKEIEHLYDPNDPIYQYIPRAHESWTTQFGDNHKTRMIHAVSELRVQQAILSNRMAALEKQLAPEVPSDPNGVKE